MLKFHLLKITKTAVKTGVKRPERNGTERNGGENGGDGTERVPFSQGGERTERTEGRFASAARDGTGRYPFLTAPV